MPSYLKEEGFGFGTTLFGAVELHLSFPRERREGKRGVSKETRWDSSPGWREATLRVPKREAETWKGLYLSSKAASRRASRMFSSGSHVLYLEGIRKKWASVPGTGKERRGCVYACNFSCCIVLYFNVKEKEEERNLPNNSRVENCI